MPLPDSHLERLREDLVVHETRLAALENSIRAQQAEADVHKMLIGLGRDQGMLNAVGEIFDHPDTAQQAHADAGSFLARHGVRLPAGVKVSMDTDGGLRAEFPGPFPVAAYWDRSAGFSSGPLTKGAAG